MAWKFHLSDALEAGMNAVVSAANAARSAVSRVLLVQHVGPDGNPQPSGADSSSVVYTHNTNEAQFDYQYEVSARDELREVADLLRLTVVELRRLNLYQAEATDTYFSAEDADSITN